MKTPSYLLLSLVALAVFLTALDQTVVVTALAYILPDMRVPPTELDRGAWIITGYLLGYTAAMPLLGRVADVYGHKRIFLMALALFALGSVAVALSPSLGWLIASRILQAVGGGATVPIGLALAADCLPEGRRGIALGAIAAAAETGGVLGPLWGGAILEFLDWRWIFWVNIPLVALVGAPLLRIPTPDVRPARSVDYVGGILLALSLTALSLGLSGTLPNGTLVPALPLVGLAGALLALFVVRTARGRTTLIPLGLFRRLPFSAANVSHLLLGGALIIAMTTVPLMTNTVLLQDPLEGGLRLMRLTAALPVGAIIGGYLTQRAGYRLPAVLGFLLSAVGFYFMSSWTKDIADPALTLHLVTAGLGFGLVLAPIATATVDAVPEEQRGVASAVVSAMRLVGMLIGLAALSSWGTGQFSVLTAHISSPFPQPGDTAEVLQQRLLDYQAQVGEAAMALYRDFFRISMVLSLLAIIPALFMARNHVEPTPREGPHT